MDVDVRTVKIFVFHFQFASFRSRNRHLNHTPHMTSYDLKWITSEEIKLQKSRSNAGMFCGRDLRN